MLTRAIPVAAVAAISAIGLRLSGCQPINTVTIDYAKVGVCGIFHEDPGSYPQESQTAGARVYVGSSHGDRRSDGWSLRVCSGRRNMRTASYGESSERA